MNTELEFDVDLIRRYDINGPRYTSYPTVDRFRTKFTEKHYRDWARRSNEDPIPRPLSLYIHLPFCDTVCFYCACNKVVTKDRSKAAVYLGHLAREMAMQAALFDRDRVVEQLHWGGGTPTFLDAEQIRELMTVTRRHFSLRSDDQGEYSIEIDPRSVDHDKLKVLRDTGFNRLSLGVQDINPRVQKAVNRIQGLEVTRAVNDSARELGYKSINMDLMYGLPYQTVESFEETLQAVIEMQPDRLAVYNYAHLPARFKPQRRINTIDLPCADEKLDILHCTIETLGRAGYVYIGMDHFARPDDDLSRAREKRQLQRNFQGYSTHADCDLVALGVSAIGRVSDSYSQNVRELDRYYDYLEAGRLPLEQGFELKPDDLLRREIINELMCNGFLDIRELEKRMKSGFAAYFSDELQLLEGMARDGLVSLDRDWLEVLPAGRLLVRNVCMVFDRYLQESKAAFSKVI